MNYLTAGGCDRSGKAFATTHFALFFVVTWLVLTVEVSKTGEVERLNKTGKQRNMEEGRKIGKQRDTERGSKTGMQDGGTEGRRGREGGRGEG